MSRRRRPHPARRARRWAGAAAVGAYAGLMVVVGWAQRAGDDSTAMPTATAASSPGDHAATTGIARLDLSATAEFVTEAPDTAVVSTTAAPRTVTPPPPAPSVVATTTTAAPRPTPTAASAPAPATPAAPPTTMPRTVAPTTMPPTTVPPTTVPPTTVPPPTTFPTNAS